MPKLLVTNKKQEALDYIKKDIESIEETNVDLDKDQDIVILDKKQVKVEDIRNLIKKLATKPLNLKQKYLIILNFETATVSAQNAFLKTLEEGNVGIFLQVRSSLNLLETIISRTQVVNLTIEYVQNDELVKILESIIKTGGIGQISSVCKKYSNKEIYDNLEIVLATLVKTNLNIKSVIKELYITKRKQNKVPLNTEIQVTYLIIKAIDSFDND